MKKNKVLIIHNHYQIRGGEDTVVKSEMEMLRQNGHEVFLYTRHNDEIRNANILFKLLLALSCIFSIKAYRDVRKIIKENSIEIVHVHNTFPLISPSVYYAAFSCRVPVVQTIHNFRLLCPGATLTRDNCICEDCINRGLKQALKHKCYRNSFFQTLSSVIVLQIHRVIGTYNKVNAYISLTDFNKDKISSLIRDDKKIFIKPNFVKEQGRGLAKNDSGNYYVFLGRLDKLKGVSFLVNAWSRINDSKLYVIGDGPEKDNLIALIKDKKIDNVELLGFIERERALEILKGAKATIVPSQCYESFGMIAVEAFSVGTPVISSRIGALELIVKDKYNGLLYDYRSYEDLIKCINLLNSDDRLRANLSIGAYETYKNHYTDTKNYVVLDDIYHNVIKNFPEGVNYD